MCGEPGKDSEDGAGSLPAGELTEGTSPESAGPRQPEGAETPQLNPVVQGRGEAQEPGESSSQGIVDGTRCQGVKQESPAIKRPSAATGKGPETVGGFGDTSEPAPDGAKDSSAPATESVTGEEAHPGVPVADAQAFAASAEGADSKPVSAASSGRTAAATGARVSARIAEAGARDDSGPVRTQDQPTASGEAGSQVKSMVEAKGDPGLISRVLGPNGQASLESSARLSIKSPASAEARSETPLETLAARGLAAALNQRGGTLTMRLIPETLGAMQVRMDVNAGVVNVDLHVVTEQAQRLLTQSLDTLRASLESKGLIVERLGVHLTPGASTSGVASGGGGTSAGMQDGQTNGSMGRQDAGTSFQHDAGDGRSRSWLGGDQRNREGHGGAGPHAQTDPIAHAGAAPGFDGVWQRLVLGVDATG